MKHREIIGKITIQEDISPLDRNKIPNTFVVHIPNPLATYYNSFSEVNVPNSVVFITKRPASFERILRATKIINAENGLQLDGAKCEVKIGSRKYSGIRVKRIHKYSDIESVQNLYKSQNFEFAKNERIGKTTNAIIRINKFFGLKEIEDGIYQSPHNKNRFYIIISKDMDWNTFRDMTFDIKNNVTVTNYDIAKGMFYENEGITDMLRVIKPNITLDMVKEIQGKYFEKLS